MSFVKKKPKSKQKLSRLQEGRVMKIVFVLLVLALLWIFFAPGAGVVTLINKRFELKKAQKEAIRIEQQIDELQNEIDRLHNDPTYLEDIARKEYGLLKKNEEVYDFSKSKPKK
jgi:cell division protein FtsB